METDEPLAYIIGDQPFLGLKIYLDSPYSAKATKGTRPFIPRPETEWWTEQLLSEPACSFSVVGLGLAARSATEFVSSGKRMKFLDLCAGSGAIGCAALAKLPNAHVYFGEIDPAHKATILKNIRENNLDESRAHVCIGDLFEPFGDIKFDVIAVNPPYIPSGRVLPKSVANYEPKQALYSGADGLDLIRRIATSARRNLAENGVLWCECDSSTAETARALFQAQGFLAELHNDQYGVPRVIVVHHHTNF